MSRTILITGGAGFIGSNFVHHLYDTYPDYRILVLDALTYAGSLENLPGAVNHASGNGRLQFWYGDVRNASLVDSLVEQSDVVVHFAAETHVTRSIYDNYHFFETDVLGTQVVANSVLKHIKRVDRFIHISTSEVYGTARAPRMDEEAPLMPMSPYASAKAGADRLVYSYFATYSLPAIIVRPFNQFGPRQHLEKVIPRFITSCLLDEPLRVHGDGSAERDFTYVEDTCWALDRLVHCDRAGVVGEVINLGYGQSISLADMAPLVAKRMGKPARPLRTSVTVLDRYSGTPPMLARPSASSTGVRSSVSMRGSIARSRGTSRTDRGGRSSCGCGTFPSSPRPARVNCTEG